MRNQKFKELDELYSNRKLTKQALVKRKNVVDALFFHICYNAKCYFEELKDKSVHQAIAGFDFCADIYTYCHVMSRHYFPRMNNGVGGTLNDSIPYIDIFELPTSLLQLIYEYAIIGKITEETEFLLFEMDSAKYILWIKYDSSFASSLACYLLFINLYKMLKFIRTVDRASKIFSSSISKH